MEKQTKIYTYRYFWEHIDGSCNCRYLSGTVEEHSTFQSTLRADMGIFAAMREYVGEIDVSFIGFTESVKEKKKDVPVNIVSDTLYEDLCKEEKENETL